MSEKLQTKFGKKVPWVLGKYIRIPRVKYPDPRDSGITLATPGKSLVLISTYVFLFYLIVGGIYISIREPLALGMDASGTAMFLYPSTHEAFIIESLVAALLVFIAGFGFLILYNTTKHSFNYVYAIKLYILGIFFVVAAFVLLQYMLGVKIGTIEL